MLSPQLSSATILFTAFASMEEVLFHTETSTAQESIPGWGSNQFSNLHQPRSAPSMAFEGTEDWFEEAFGHGPIPPKKESRRARHFKRRQRARLTRRQERRRQEEQERQTLLEVEQEIDSLLREQERRRLLEEEQFELHLQEQERRRQVEERERYKAERKAAKKERRRLEKEAKTAEVEHRRQEEDRERYKAERKAAKKERRRLEREAKAAVEQKSEPSGGMDDSPMSFTVASTDDSNGSEAADVWACESVAQSEIQKYSDDDLERERRLAQEMHLQRDRVAAKKQDQRQKQLVQVQRLIQERVLFWRKEVDKEEKTVGVIVQLCATELCRKRPDLSAPQILKNSEVKAKLIVVSKQAYSELFKDSIHSRVVVKGMQQRDLNGRTGTIQKWEGTKGKFYVGLDTRKNKNLQYVYCMPGNLEALPLEVAKKTRLARTHSVVVSSFHNNEKLNFGFELEKDVVSGILEVDSIDTFLEAFVVKRNEDDRLFEARRREEGLSHQNEKRRGQEKAMSARRASVRKAKRRRCAERKRHEKEEWEQ